jgi:pyruvate,orthophosphate dikinase
VTIRLLDPPLHEFLPHEGTPELDSLCDTLAAEMKGRAGQHMSAVKILKSRIHGLQEANPMLGLRGCRLGIRHPGQCWLMGKHAEDMLWACFEAASVL